MEPPFRLSARHPEATPRFGVDAACGTSRIARRTWPVCTMRPGGRYERASARSRCSSSGSRGATGCSSWNARPPRSRRSSASQIRVYGFDNGPAGLPAFIGDHRDHPDKWQPGDFPMDEALLRSRLGRRTTLVLGNVAETVPRFFDDPDVPPVGFIAFDLDLYSSTTHALRILSLPGGGRSTMSPSTSTTPSTPSATASPASCSRSTSSTGHPRQDRPVARTRRRSALPGGVVPAEDVHGPRPRAISARALDRGPLHRSLPPPPHARSRVRARPSRP